jgi:hypothetical protein
MRSYDPPPWARPRTLDLPAIPNGLSPAGLLAARLINEALEQANISTKNDRLYVAPEVWDMTVYESPAIKGFVFPRGAVLCVRYASCKSSRIFAPYFRSDRKLRDRLEYKLWKAGLSVEVPYEWFACVIDENHEERKQVKIS